MSLTLGYEPADPPPQKKTIEGAFTFFVYVSIVSRKMSSKESLYFRSYSCRKTQKRDFEHIHKKTNFDKLNIA